MCAMNARARARTHTRTDERRPLSPGLTIFHYYYINKTFVDEDRDDDTPLCERTTLESSYRWCKTLIYIFPRYKIFT